MDILKKFYSKIPKLPLTALIFYLVVLFLWNHKFIASPSELVLSLEKLYESFGYLGLIIATFLEGTVYLGLYIPGSFIIALAVFFSDGTFISLTKITLIVAITLTMNSFVNYWLGRYLISRKHVEANKSSMETKIAKKGILFAMLHPNFLAFYFFKEGLDRKSPARIYYVPVAMIPYGLFIAYVLYLFSDFARAKLESPTFILSVIIIWLIASLAIEHKKEIRKFVKKLY
jgi:membrane protein YqaA with SNARE-associated domain